ncbi:unnamed protein product [Adineta steineri]|uniref:Uncharacterized protein n=1 Tax=Adineta steineri TaxID=433720 RepID=A0A819IXQ8_9BILA|nr:unnamed protein product [Adineta steineri]
MRTDISPLISVSVLACTFTTIAVVIILSLIPVYLPTRQLTVPDCAARKAASVYDYIVVGSGPGGSTVATRLALNNFSVLLIEAGPDYDGGDTRTPGFWAQTQLNLPITINFYPYLYSKENDTTILYPRGMTLGGSAQLNALVAMTVNPSEWDNIAAITGDSNWSSQNMIGKYQPLVENCQYCLNNDTDTNKNGWADISAPAYRKPSPQLNITNPAISTLFEAINERLNYNPNVNENKSYDSWFYLPQSINQDEGIRSSTYKRIKTVQSLRPSNFHIWTNTFVTKLIIDPTTKNTCGVQYVKGSNLYKASPLASPSLNIKNVKKSVIYAKREIIVSGGQWLSPQLLQLSGIGDRTLLEKLGIPVIQDLPGVGKNQQEHSEISYIVKLKTNENIYESNNSNCIFNKTSNDPCLIDYLNNPTASIYSSNLNIFSIFRSAEPIVPNFPDSVFLFVPQRFTGIRTNWLQTMAQYPFGTYLTVDIELGRNKNNLGNVYIQSTNPFDTPLIEMKHFQDENGPVEVNQFIQHIRFLRDLFTNSQFSKYVDYEDLPGSQFQTDEQLSAFIYEYVWGHHACCTNKMGNTETDPLAVVNSKAQVKGINNLRICDISIFPVIPGYYPMVPIFMAAEKIADDIIIAAKS